MNHCRLCGAELYGDQKIKSHILTESQYIRPLTKRAKQQILGFNSGNRFDPCHSITDNTILCKNCDNKLNLYENERGRLLTFLNSTQQSDQIVIANGINGKLVKLACLADLYRCSITNIPQFKYISLGEKHEKRIASILTTGEDQENAYPTIIAKVKTIRDLAIVQIPYKKRIDKLLYYRTEMPNGLLWLTKVDSQTNLRLSEISVDSVSGSAKATIFEDEKIARAILIEAARSMIK